MNSADSQSTPGVEPPDIPGIRTWRGVYWLVAGSFILWLGLLLALTLIFS